LKIKRKEGKMATGNIEIIPSTKVHDLLEAYFHKHM
jgi:hypothetical protein